jgi:hypothetical protein
MSDWQAGDLAMIVNTQVIVCSCGCTLFSGENCPPEGAIREVVEVCLDEQAFESDRCDEYLYYLVFFDGTEAMTERCRKVKPAQADELVRGIIAAMTNQPEQVPA